MTKEEWKKVEDTLDGLYGFVEMLVDGHRVRFEKRQISYNRLGIMTFVDGWYRGKWTKDDPEIRYLRHIEKAVWKKAEIKRMEKVYGKQQWKKVKSKYDTKVSYFSPLWFSVASIRRHYEKTFENIELLSINGLLLKIIPKALTNTTPEMA